VVRTPPPRGYEKTITNYLAFRIRNPAKNAEISVGRPEPGPCSLDVSSASARGWVVPVAYASHTGAVTGKETIYITAKQYYFWFLGDTIAGITPRIELCPGLGSAFSESAPPVAAAGALVTTALPLPAPAPEAGKKSEAVREVKKTRISSGKAHHAVKKVGNSRRRAPADTRKSPAPEPVRSYSESDERMARDPLRSLYSAPMGRAVRQ
jgi:hypothetical protein